MRSFINAQDFLILIVDDLPTNLKILREILEPIGYELTFATNGRKALERVETIQPDLILLDLMMPDLDGLEVCEILYNNPSYQDIPIIFLTAQHEKDYLIRAFQQGAVDYITKPFQSLELLARIKTHLELKQYRDRLKKQLEQEQLLKKITANILSHSQLKDILDHIVNGTRDLLQADRVTVCRFLSSEKSKMIAESVVEGLSPRLEEIITDNQWFKREQFCGDSARDNSFQVFENSDKNVLTTLQLDYLNHWQIQSEAVFPLNYLENSWGLLIVDYCIFPHRWKTEELNLVTQISQQAAIAIHQSELYQQLFLANQELEKLANLDGLTQIANRRHFDRSISSEWQRLKRDKIPIALIFCDVDYFKKYNDVYGHPAGDRCLQKIAQTITGVINRPADLVARYGGEEFVILLPNTNLDGAIHVAKKVQQAVADLRIPHAQGVDQYITLSMGISIQIPTDSAFEQLIENSDKALFEAKAKGRNQFSVIDNPQQIKS